MKKYASSVPVILHASIYDDKFEVIIPPASHHYAKKNENMPPGKCPLK